MTIRTSPTGHRLARPSARIEYLRVENFRALRRIELKNITPLTVLLGPNGSGKSTVFDVFAFLSECFDSGLRRAWDRRGRGKELKTRGSEGPIVIESPATRHDHLFGMTAIGEIRPLRERQVRDRQPM
jgi:predicted ATPase